MGLKGLKAKATKRGTDPFASPDDGAGRAADWRVLDWIAMEGVVSAVV